jgi:hypothetical protein
VLTLSVGFWLGALAAFGQKNHLSVTLLQAKLFLGVPGKNELSHFEANIFSSKHHSLNSFALSCASITLPVES